MAESKDVFYTEEGEIEDLEQLLPDIQHKIVDMEEMKAASTERFQQAVAKVQTGHLPLFLLLCLSSLFYSSAYNKKLRFQAPYTAPYGTLQVTKRC